MDFVELVKAVLETNACAEAKQAAQNFLDSVGTENEAEMKEKMIEEFKADVIPVEGIIAFCGSDAAKEKFGEETAAKFLAHAIELKNKGEKYCDCPACTACLKVIENA